MLSLFYYAGGVNMAAFLTVLAPLLPLAAVNCYNDMAAFIQYHVCGRRAVLYF